MRADNFAQLFAFEEPIERAVLQVLTAAGVSAFRSRDRAKNHTPCVHVRLWPGAEHGHRGEYKPGFFMADAWHGQLVLTVFTNRADPAQAAAGSPAYGAAANVDHGPDVHAALLGTVRVAMLYASANFTEANLPMHYIQEIKAVGSKAETDADTSLDITPVSYQVLFGIRKDAWPLPSA